MFKRGANQNEVENFSPTLIGGLSKSQKRFSLRMSWKWYHWTRREKTVLMNPILSVSTKEIEENQKGARPFSRPFFSSKKGARPFFKT